MDEANLTNSEPILDGPQEWIDRFRLRDADTTHPAMQVTMALVADHQGEMRCIGSAFAAAPGLAITASHVVQDLQNYQERRDGYKKPDATFGVVAIQWVGNDICSWLVDQIYGSVSSDIAFLRFIRPNWWGDGPGQIKPRSARLSLNPPALERSCAFSGFLNHP